MVCPGDAPEAGMITASTISNMSSLSILIVSRFYTHKLFTHNILSVKFHNSLLVARILAVDSFLWCSAYHRVTTADCQAPKREMSLQPT